MTSWRFLPPTPEEQARIDIAKANIEAGNYDEPEIEEEAVAEMLRAITEQGA